MWPFGRKESAFDKKTLKKDVERSDDFLRIASINFFGPFTTSPNGRYILAWCDADQESSRGGFRYKGEGSYVLLDDNKLILTGKIQRPNDGKVVDNGTFVINDWMFGEGLKGTFYAIDCQGNVLVKKLFRANLFNNGISNDGRFAVCQTCSSDNSDSNILTFWDLHSGKILWQKPPESGWADSYEFEVEKEIIYLIYKEQGKFAYSFLGDFLDEELWLEEKIKHANGFGLSVMASKSFQYFNKSKDANIGKKILSLLGEASKRGLDNYPNEQAVVYRIMGEILETLGEKIKAIEHYEQALKLNPKVGIRRKLDALKKEHSY